MSDTNEERPWKYRMLNDIYKEEYESIRSGAKRKTSLLKGSGNKRLKFVSKCNLGKRGRKTSSSVRCEASTSRTKKVSLSRGSKNNCSVSALGVKKAQLAQPAMSFSQSLLTSSNDEIVSALQLISLSNGPPAPGQPETFMCVTNENPSEFSAEVVENYMRSC